ncbi:Hypothetical protein ORPV_949 [Orpheovirus IHUMI-LCC2]|uniref:Uncharacterized protein n=1 Tax=Orpheovirus IHUMI-LCC2 TaxID=2023057 RepID=A0A2I2L5P3_9VIRU|nr:Hypothetical protein ORPV_949 [Orpheovirus IHUMI-LCC2]SNW62853.1 Hypothetical protein ORPV_949 [Orpheovirus IHUMI-LCC2]
MDIEYFLNQAFNSFPTNRNINYNKVYNYVSYLNLQDRNTLDRFLSDDNNNIILLDVRNIHGNRDYISNKLGSIIPIYKLNNTIPKSSNIELLFREGTNSNNEIIRLIEPQITKELPLQYVYNIARILSYSIGQEDKKFLLVYRSTGPSRFYYTGYGIWVCEVNGFGEEDDLLLLLFYLYLSSGDIKRRTCILSMDRYDWNGIPKNIMNKINRSKGLLLYQTYKNDIYYDKDYDDPLIGDYVNTRIIDSIIFNVDTNYSTKLLEEKEINSDVVSTRII